MHDPASRRTAVVVDDANWVAPAFARVAILNDDQLRDLIDGRLHPIELNGIDLSLLLARALEDPDLDYSAEI